VSFETREWELAGEAGTGDQYQQIYLRRLRHRQLSLALLALCVGACMVLAVPLAMLLVPAVNRILILGLPLSLLMLVLPAFPLYVLVGRAFESRSNALDRALSRLVDEDEV
jgi:membrane protein implicated in regulation of membrane protease activity